MPIRTIGLVGTGVIGASWATLFLSKGLKVIVSDPAPGAKERLQTFIHEQWPLMERIGLATDADPENWQFVDNVADHLDEVDYVQEVCSMIKATASLGFPNYAKVFLRTRQRIRSSKRDCSRILTLRRHVMLFSLLPRPDFHRHSSSVVARRLLRGS